jgi:hypothetical protein
VARWSSWTATRFIQEPLWYFYYMEERFIAVWMMLSIVAEDLWNELKKQHVGQQRPGHGLETGSREPGLSGDLSWAVPRTQE